MSDAALRAAPPQRQAAKAMGSENGHRRDPRTILFLHIPKTGGVTLESILEREYGRGNCFTVHGAVGKFSVEHFRSMSESERAEYRVLKGHMRYGLHTAVPRPFAYLTMLRNPVSRVISQYYHILRKPEQVYHHEVTKKKLSIEEYIERGLNPRASNGQTQELVGIEKGGIDYGSTDAKILEQAKQHVQSQFLTVGLTERFVESILIWQRELKWKTPYFYRRNVARNKSGDAGATKEQKELVKKYNMLDVQLYEFCKERFERTVAAQPKSLSSAVSRFNAANKSYGKLVALGKDVRSFASLAWNNF